MTVDIEIKKLGKIIKGITDWKILRTFPWLFNYLLDRFSFHVVLSSTALGFSLKKNRVKDIIVVTLRKSSCTFRRSRRRSGSLSMIDLIYLSLSSDALNVDFSLFSGILHVPHCSLFAIISRFVRPQSTRSNWSREKLGFIFIRTRSSLCGKTKSVVRGSQGVCERRRGVRTHCDSSCHWGFGNMSVYASRMHRFR